MGDGDAKVMATLLKQGSLPNLKVLDVSGNQITATGEGFFTRALKNETVQDIIIFLYKFDQYSKLLAGSKLENGEAQIRVCWRDEIDESMAVSRGSHKPDSPWRTNFEAMSLVVPIRKMGNNLVLPLKVEDYDEEITGTTQLENYKDSKI